MAGLGTDQGEAAISPNTSPGALLPLLPRPEGPAHWATGGPHGSTLSLLGAGYQSSRQLSGSREPLDSWVLLALSGGSNRARGFGGGCSVWKG